jgi:hypothetical protein
VRTDRLEPALEIGKVVQILLLVFMRNNTGVTRDIGNGVLARDEVPVGEPLVEHCIQPAVSLT